MATDQVEPPFASILDGRDSTHYSRFDTASRAEVAWELLRRNRTFQRNCELVQCGSMRDRAAAREAGLRKFKDCREDYSQGEAPQFRVNNPALYKPSGSSRRKSVPLRPGEVAVVFDLQQVERDPASLESQVRGALLRMQKIAKARVRSKPKRRRVVDRSLSACLQLADLEGSGASSEEIKKLIPYLTIPLPANGTPDAGHLASVNRRLFDLKRRTIELIQGQGYKLMAAHSAKNPRS